MGGAQAERINVFAAASLSEGLNEVVRQYKLANSDADIRVSYASSGILARQIEHGAQADIFISANHDWVKYLEQKEVVSADKTWPLLSNLLVVVSDDGDETWLDLLKNGRFAMGDPTHVPAGIYAKQAFENFSIWDEVKSNAVFGENVRISLRLVAKGEVNAAIVYNSDALIEPNLTVTHTFDAALHDGITYPLVQLNTKPATIKFAEFIRGPEALAIFQKFGFVAPSISISEQTDG